MSKTANTVNIGDKFYLPEIKEIQEYVIDSIVKSKDGIKISSSSSWHTRSDDAFYNPAISRTIKLYIDKRNNRTLTYYLNIEDAKEKQRELQVGELFRLQHNVDKATKDLNDFTNEFIIKLS